MRRYEGKNGSAGLLFAVTSLFWCAQYSYTQFINPELARMGRNAAFMGLVSGAYGLTQTLLRIPAGMAADRLGRQKPFVLLGCLLTALSSGGMLLFYRPGGFLFFRGLAGAASAAWVSFTILFSAYFPHQEAPRRISQLNLANMGGRLGGFLVVLFLAPALGVPSAFAFSLTAGVFALLFGFCIRETPTGRQGISLRELAEVSRDRYLRASAIVAVLAQTIAFSTYAGFTVNVAKALGAGDAMLSWLNIALLLPTLLVNWLLTTYLIHKYSARALVALGFVAGCLYCLLVPLAQNMGQLLAIQTLGGCCSSLTFAALLGQCVRDVRRERRAVAMGFFQAVYGIGMTLGPVLMGLITDWAGLRIAFFCVSGFAAVSAVLAWRMMDVPPPKSNQRAEPGSLPAGQTGE